MTGVRRSNSPPTLQEGAPRTTAELDGDDLRRTLTTRAGEVVCAERQRAVRAFDDTEYDAHHALSTMAVRIAVQLVEPALLAAETDDQLERTVVSLFTEE